MFTTNTYIIPYKQNVHEYNSSLLCLNVEAYKAVLIKPLAKREVLYPGKDDTFYIFHDLR